MLAIGRSYNVDMLARARDLPHAPAWDEVWAVVVADQTDPNGIWKRVTGSPFAGWTKTADVMAYAADVIRAFGGMMSKDGVFFENIQGYKRPVEVLLEEVEAKRKKDLVEESGDATTYGSGANNSADKEQFEELLGITESARNPDVEGFKAMLRGLESDPGPQAESETVSETAEEIATRIRSTGSFSDEDVARLTDLVPGFDSWLDAALGPEGRSEVASTRELLEIYDLASQ